MGDRGYGALSNAARRSGLLGVALMVASVVVNISSGPAWAAPGVRIVESGASTAVAEGGTKDAYTIVLTSKPKKDVTISIRNGDGQVRASPKKIVFEDDEWDEPQQVRVSAVNDKVVEGAHTGTLTHTAASKDPAYDGIAIAPVVAAITDNDAPDIEAVLSVADSPPIVEGPDALMKFTVSLTPASSKEVTVKYRTVDGTATAPADYEGFPLTPLTFAKGETSKEIAVPVVDDAIDEITETVTVELSDPKGATIAAGADAATGTIVDDDNQPPEIDRVLITDGTGVPKTTFDRGETAVVTVDFSDPGVMDTHEVRVSWQDGTPDDYHVVVGTGAEQRTVTVTHAYEVTAPQTITAFIDDGEGGVVSGDAATIFVVPGGGAQLETVGLVDPATGFWSLRSSAGDVTSFFYGNPGDFPIIGDWDCDGDETPGMYRQSDGFVYLRNSNTQGVADIKFFFGNPGDIPIVGDFDGDACDTVSIYRPSQSKVFVINELGENNGGLGAAELEYFFGNPGDKPFVGDFDGDGVETIGLHRESTGLVYFRNTHTQGVADNEFIFGDPGDRLVAGDWIQTGIDSPAVFRPDNTTFFFRHSNTQGLADDQFQWGASPDIPIAGFFGLG